VRTLWQDLRYGARMLRKNYGLAAIAVLSLALGIGANTAIFTWLKALYLKPLPGVAENHRLVTLHTVMTRTGNRPIGVSYPDYQDFRDRNDVLSGLSVFNLDTYNLQDGNGQPERIWGSLVSANYFEVLGAHPTLGRFFTPSEDRTAGSYCGDIPERFWIAGTNTCGHRSLWCDGILRHAAHTRDRGSDGSWGTKRRCTQAGGEARDALNIDWGWTGIGSILFVVTIAEESAVRCERDRSIDVYDNHVVAYGCRFICLLPPGAAGNESRPDDGAAV
jgi:MacB-like periplasmic core domain